MIKIVCIFLLCTFHSLFSNEVVDPPLRYVKNLVTSTVKIEIQEFPTAWNPSIIEVAEGFILTFRYLPEPEKLPCISYIGAAFLDRSFNQISPAELLDVRKGNPYVPSQSEDARLFSYKGDLYVIYNDNPKVMNPRNVDRRDIYIAKLSYSIPRDIREDGTLTHFHLDQPIKLIHPNKYASQKWEKNWIPFVADETLFLSYSLNPHEVLVVNLESGVCSPIYSSSFPSLWGFGALRGGTPATLVDQEYLAFFHSAKTLVSGASNHEEVLWHYVMGAYTFSTTPPFNITRISSLPINEKSFYIKSDHPKRVIYPGGYVISGENIYVSYGKDDSEMWIAVINKDKLFRSLRPTYNTIHSSEAISKVSSL